jgi:hypothetical protein
MPGDDDAATADTTWFRRQNEFERDELRHLVTYKRDTLRVVEDGVYSKCPNYTYPHILPAVSLRKAFYEPMAEAIIGYLDDEGIQQHTELLNLKSSQPSSPGRLCMTGDVRRTAEEQQRGFDQRTICGTVTPDEYW